MRPRFVNRGKGIPDTEICPVDRASMRPRFVNRGKINTMTLQFQTPLSFNEAAIRESRKATQGQPRNPHWIRLQ